MRRAFLPLWLLLMAALGGIGSSMVHAQLTNQEKESLTLRAGEVFEIAAVHSFADPQFGWVLTKDRNFIQAGRNQVFRVRFTQPGMYELSGEVMDREEKDAKRRSLMITVEQQTPTAEEETEPTETALLKTDRPSSGNDVYSVSAAQQFLRLIPTSSAVQTMAIDLDVSEDSDTDGKPGNDSDLPDSFFTTEGTALTLWFSSPDVERIIRVHALLQGGEEKEQTLTVVPEEMAEGRAGETPILPRGQIIAEVREDGSVEFSVNPREVESFVDPLLYHWDFGDGKQSLLDRPIHTYKTGGQYSVLVRIVNLVTGEEVKSLETDVLIRVVDTGEPGESAGTAAGTQGSTQAGAGSSEVTKPIDNGQSSSEAEAPGGSSKVWGMVWLLVKIIVVLLIFMGLGFLVVMLIGKLRKGGPSLQEALEKAEQKLVQKKSIESVIESTPPLAIADDERTEVIDAVTPEQEEVEEKQAPPKPRVETPVTEEESDVPDWLKKESTPEPEAPTQKAEPAQTETAVPSWLKKGMEEAQKAGQTLSTPPPAPPSEEPPIWKAPVTPPSAIAEPEPAPAERQAELPAPPVNTAVKPPEQKAADVPDWLKKGMEEAKSTESEQTTSPPSPAQDITTPPAAAQTPPAPTDRTLQPEEPPPPLPTEEALALPTPSGDITDAPLAATLEQQSVAPQVSPPPGAIPDWLKQEPDVTEQPEVKPSGQLPGAIPEQPLPTSAPESIAPAPSAVLPVAPAVTQDIPPADPSENVIGFVKAEDVNGDKEPPAPGPV